MQIINGTVRHFMPRMQQSCSDDGESLQLDTRAHCDVNSVQGAGGIRTLSNGGTWRLSATLLAARHSQSRDSEQLTKQRGVSSVGGGVGIGTGVDRLAARGQPDTPWQEEGPPCRGPRREELNLGPR